MDVLMSIFISTVGYVLGKHNKYQMYISIMDSCISYVNNVVNQEELLIK